MLSKIFKNVATNIPFKKLVKEALAREAHSTEDSKCKPCGSKTPQCPRPSAPKCPSKSGGSKDMKALRFTFKTKKLELVKIPIPKVSDMDVLVKVAFAGICGTDIHIIKGEFPCNEERQFTMGHEISGTVAEVGKKVKGIKKGDKVAVNPNSWCNACKFCHKGDVNFCENGALKTNIGIMKDGGWAEYVVAPIHLIHKLPEKVSLQQEFPCNEERQFTMGHEISGTVAKVGKKVKAVKEGDKVAVNPNTWCNACKFCHKGEIHFCETGALKGTIGIMKDGGWAEYVVAPIHLIHKLPQKVSLQQGVLVEPMSCLAHTWSKMPPLIFGQRILLLGAGLIGNLCAAILHFQGQRNVTVSEPQEGRRKLLERLETGFDCIKPDELQSRQKANSNYLFDVIIETTGNAKAIEHAFGLLDYGATFCLFGCPSSDSKVSISPLDAVIKEILMVGTIINPFSFSRAVDAVNSMGCRYIDFQKLGIQTFKLEDYNNAIETLQKGTISKAVFQF